jgi:hypothetical protein
VVISEKLKGQAEVIGFHIFQKYLNSKSITLNPEVIIRTVIAAHKAFLSLTSSWDLARIAWSNWIPI